MLGGGTEAGGDEQGTDLVAVQTNGVRLVVDPGTADMDCRGVGDQALLFGVAVETGHRGQSSGDRGRRPTLGFEFRPKVSMSLRRTSNNRRWRRSKA